MRIFIPVFIVLLTLTSCITTDIPDQFEYSTSDEEGFLVLGSPRFGFGGFSSTNQVVLLRVDLEKKVFFDKPVLIEACEACIGLKSRTYSFPESNPTLSTYRMLKIEPGTYAFARESTTRTVAYISHKKVYCHKNQLPVFEILPGTVNVFNTAGNPSQHIINTVQKSMTELQNITAPVVSATAIAIIAVEGGNCTRTGFNSDTFKIVKMIHAGREVQ